MLLTAPSHREDRHTPLLSHCFDFYCSVLLVLLCCLSGPTLVQASALPVRAQPAQTFQSVSCSDRQGLLPVWAGLASPGRDPDAHCLPPPGHACLCAAPKLGPAGGGPTAHGCTHLSEHTRTPRSRCSPETPGAQRCRGSLTPRGCRARAALALGQSGCDLGREWEKPCPQQPCLQPSPGTRQGDPGAAPHPQPATAERGAVRPRLKAAPAPRPPWSRSGCWALPMSGKYISRLRDKFPSMIWQ